MNQKEGMNSQYLENQLRTKFVRVQPDENFIKSLSDKLLTHSFITLEKSKKYLYHLALVLFGLFSGLSIWWLLKKIFFRKSSPEE